MGEVPNEDPLAEPGPIIVQKAIRLNDEEQKIFSFLKEMLAHFGMTTVMRVAGGWVRDKLIGGHSDDIDIALDNVMGTAFAQKVNEYLIFKNLETHHIGVIRENPEKSKHLETVAMHLFGTSIDFVNLRTETYSEHSRVPEAKIGSPSEDAFRRDLTINALFYNINTGMIEDYTKMGVADLEAGIIRTPLPSEQTLVEDPLRALRCIRFASRLAFKFHPPLAAALSTPSVVDALSLKISRERIGKEIDGMLNGPPPPNWQLKCVTNIRQMTRFLYTTKPHITKEQRRLLLLAALLEPLGNACYTDKKGKKLKVTSWVLKESLKLPNKDADDVAIIHEVCVQFKQLLASPSPSRKDVGLVLHKGHELWIEALDVALIEDLPPFTTALAYDIEHTIPPEAAAVVEKYKSFVDKYITGYKLDEIWKEKPLLDGGAIMKLLKLQEGPQINTIKEKFLCWQLEHPSSTTTEAEQWLLANYPVSTDVTSKKRTKNKKQKKKIKSDDGVAMDST